MVEFLTYANCLSLLDIRAGRGNTPHFQEVGTTQLKLVEQGETVQNWRPGYGAKSLLIMCSGMARKNFLEQLILRK